MSSRAAHSRGDAPAAAPPLTAHLVPESRPEARLAAEPAGPAAPADEPIRREDHGGPVQRALAILEVLGSVDDGAALGVVEIARQLGRDKSQVSRALKLLADAGFVDREVGSLRYRVGTRLFAIGARAVGQRLRDEADALVEREAARLGERVDVCVRSGGTCMTVSTAAPETELRAVGWVGRTVPLVCTAAGRALLFDLDASAIARLVVADGLPAAGPAAPRSLDELLARTAEDRAHGWSCTRHEMDRGLLSVGAPVRDARGAVVAAVAVSGPDSRLDPVLDEVRSAVLRAATDLSRNLGGARGNGAHAPPGDPPAPPRRSPRRSTLAPTREGAT